MLSMFQMDSHKAKHSIIQHETLGHASLVTNDLTKTFGNPFILYFCKIWFMFGFDETDEPHLPHTAEFFVHSYKVMQSQIVFKFL